MSELRSWEDLGLHIPTILLPQENADYEKWAVVACDQYTSDPGYWEAIDEFVADAPSTLRLILPEAYLGQADEAERTEIIHEAMRSYAELGILREMEPGCMLVERTAQGRTRLGLVIAIDLEKYDFSKGSTSMIRATEGTVVERIPPRLRVRKGASLELPHIIVLIDDPDRTVIEPLADIAGEPIYDTDLNGNGGHIKGSFIPESNLSKMHEAFDALYEKACGSFDGVAPIFMAIGDGNHSLATAKTSWEQIKAELSDEERQTHPARYALCEIENIHDSGIVFEPIYRVAFAAEGKDGNDIVKELVEVLAQQNGAVTVCAPDSQCPDGCFAIPFFTADDEGIIVVADPSSKLTVGVLQNAIDVLVNEKGSCSVDYIHGLDEVKALGKQSGNAGFLLPAMDKSELFEAVAVDGSLPRKTFSMGEANEKRYYIEARKIL